ncbi:hypothetical protein [Rheinheimera sp. MMS21-TC3]|uniref:hypothetical protein n=1 Tax=Rheinheimera sp. MMS21-TC3 TaxID=3072790 RepID=UPI0028C4B0EB|nr:hypothetical protein [Rheinheimera sp. MMS21-TC3]WNO61432.1 hypothetical protein RDV63_10850 [Rheinheimera sp. MMS21-TC3]
MPKRLINKALVYIGLFGVLFQISAFVFAWWHDIGMQLSWLLTLAGPLLCIVSGITPALQLQKEPEAKQVN